MATEAASGARAKSSSAKAKQTARAKTKAKARTPQEIARAGFDALAAHDIDGVLANWSPEGVQDWIALGIFRGHDEIREVFRQTLAATPDFEIVVERIVADDECACVQW